MSKIKDRDAINEIVAAHGWPYETKNGERFWGCPVSGLPSLLREHGWRISRSWDIEYDTCLRIVDARYVGGVRPKAFCRVVFGEAAAFGFNPAFHAFMIKQGACYVRVAASFEDTGDAENGPHLTGCQVHDLHSLDGIEYAVFEDGTTDRAKAMPVVFDTQGIECYNYAR